MKVVNAISNIGAVAVYLLNSSTLKETHTALYFQLKDAAVILMNAKDSTDA